MVGRTGDASPVSPAVVTPLYLVTHDYITRHRASTSMYSLTFCVRVMLPARHQWKPAVHADAVMLRTPPPVFFTDKKVFSVTSPDNWQNKVSGRLRELLKKKLKRFLQCGHCAVCRCLAAC